MTIKYLLRMLPGVLLLFVLVAVSQHTAKAAVAGRNLPANDKIRFFIGQELNDQYSFFDNVLAPNQYHPLPRGITRYVGIMPQQNSQCFGICPIGVIKNEINGLLSVYPNDVSIAVGFAIHGVDSNGNCNQRPLLGLVNDPSIPENEAKGYKDEVKDLVLYLKSTNRPVFLRIGYEFDGPWNCHNPTLYKLGFQYIKDRINEEDASNIATVWQSATFPTDQNGPNGIYNYSRNNHLNQWYPGDSYVDWVAMSTFFYEDIGVVPWKCGNNAVPGDPRQRFNKMLDFGRNKNKPAMIAEASPQGYDIGAQTGSCINKRSDITVSDARIWDLWYRDFFTYIHDNRDVIRAVIYINSNWQDYPYFACAAGASTGASNCPAGYWGNSRLEDSGLIRQRVEWELQSNIYENGWRQANQRLAYGNNNRSIPGLIEAEHFDTGGPGVAYNDITPGQSNSYGWPNQGGALRIAHVDVAPINGSHSDHTVGWTQNGEWLRYRVNINQSGSYRVAARVASGISNPGSLVVKIDGAEIGTIDVGGTNGWGNYQWLTFNTELTANNNRTLELAISGGGFNVDKVTFVRTGD